MIFGDESTVRPWRGDHRVQLHGPGWSKVLLAEDRADRWSEYLDLMGGIATAALGHPAQQVDATARRGELAARLPVGGAGG